MPDIDSLIDRHRSEVEAEIEKLRPAAEEFDRLMAYKDSMGAPKRARTTTRTRSGNSSPRSGGSGGSSGGPNREEQFMKALADKPGASISDVAKIIGDVSNNYLYRVRDNLVEKGFVTKDGNEHTLTETGMKEIGLTPAAS